MRQGRLTRCLASLAGLLLLAPSVYATTDEEVLVDEINKYEVRSPQEPTLGELVDALRAVVDKVTVDTCDESLMVRSGKLVLSTQADGKACRLYDLAFPTLATWTARAKVGSVPVERFELRDYISWLRGDYDNVYRRIEKTRMMAEPPNLRKLWPGQLEFASGLATSGSLTEFTLGDLHLGSAFSFTDSEKATLMKLVFEAKAGGTWSQFVESPENFLRKIHFKWDPLKRVYEIFVDFDFLPIAGPVAVVDYQMQYKLTVEKMLRSVMLRALSSLTKVIPNPTAKKIVQVALTDAFELIDMMYEYQANRIIDTLELAMNGSVPTAFATTDVERGLYIMYAQRGNLLMEYILAQATGGSFDLNALDKLGKGIRYQDLKNKRILFTNIHSKLVLDKGCDVDVVHNYFGVCTKNTGKQYLYSMLSEHSVLFWNLGAPVIHDYQMQSKVMLKRVTSWLLSVGARVFSLPIPRVLVDQLVSISKGIAKAGALDEAYLLNYLQETKTLDSGNEFATYHLPWLFRQNLVPFLPHSEANEAKVIDANAALLLQTL